jgi:hypothetical protein
VAGKHYHWLSNGHVAKQYWHWHKTGTLSLGTAGKSRLFVPFFHGDVAPRTEKVNRCLGRTRNSYQRLLSTTNITAFSAPCPLFGIFTIPVCLTGFELSSFIFPKEGSELRSLLHLDHNRNISAIQFLLSVPRLWPKLSIPSHTMSLVLLPPVCHLTLIPEYTGETGSLSSCCNGRP